jgi:hypothetical protein
MGTRATIGIQREDGRIEYIAVTRFGYPEYTGKILKEKYNTPNKIKGLLRYGDVSVLGNGIGHKQSPRLIEKSNYCIFYIRDLNGDPEKFKSRLIESDKWADGEDNMDYNYIFAKGKWWCKDRTSFELKAV